MEPITPMIFLGYFNIAIIIAKGILVILGIYALILLIKALRIYIKKNS